MKKVIVGPNGVGKSTTAEALLKKCAKCAYVDAEWCRAINPFLFTPATKKAVTDNIYCLFKNYLLCDDIETIVFPYGFHGGCKEIFDEVMERLKKRNIDFKVVLFLQKCSMEENRKRAIADGRDTERIQRGIENTFHFYDHVNYPCIDSTELTPDQVAERIIREVEQSI